MYLFKIIIYWLCYYICPSFTPFVPLHQALCQLHQAIPILWSMSMGYAYTFFGYSISYAVLCIPMTFCNYQFVLLNSSTSFTHLPYHAPILQPSKHFPFLWYSLLVLLIFLSKLNVHRYVFIAIFCYIFFFFLLMFKIILLLFNYSCLGLSTTTLHPPHLPPLLPPPLGFVHVFYIVVPENPTLLPSIISSHLPSGYCQIVLNFNVSGDVLFACLFCWIGYTWRWDHMVFVPPCLAYFT